MGRLAAYVIAAFAVVPFLQQLGRPGVPESNPPIAPSLPVEHSGKGDRLSAAPPGGRSADIIAIEVVGLNRAAIVYRDRDGKVLFRTDLLSNATVVVRGVSVPAVTIRDGRDRSVAPVPVDARPNRERQRVPVGCDPAISPLAEPSPLTGYCITENFAARTFAAAVDVSLRLP